MQSESGFSSEKTLLPLSRCCNATTARLCRYSSKILTSDGYNSCLAMFHNNLSHLQQQAASKMCVDLNNKD